MKSRIVVVLLFTAQFALAQSLKIKEFVIDTLDHKFPVIESADRPAVANKINAVIQKEWGVDPKAKSPMGEREMGEDEYFGYAIHTNNDRVLSFNIESSYAACGLHITCSDYNFEAKTGAAIDWNKVFGTDGMSRLKKLLFKTWKAKCKEAAEDKEESRADEYKQCLVTSEEEKRTDLDFNRVLLMNNEIHFWAGSCLEGTAYDFEADRTHGPHGYSLGMLLPMLTPYGFSLFVDKGTAPLQTLMRGTIDGKYPITLTLLPGDNGMIGGMIVYDRVGVPINLTGTMNGNQVTFHELEGSTELSTIETSWDGSKLSGMFTNLKTKKQLPFVATVVK